MATEKRLIDANSLTWSIGIGDDCKQFFYVKAENIDNAPTVDAVEVVHGRWEKHKCTSCGYPEPGYYDHIEDCIVYTPTAFCPNCGAKMDGDGNA